MPYDAFADDAEMPIAWPPLASYDVRFMSPMASGSIAFRSAGAIGVALPPVIAAIMSPTALPAAAGSPEFCAVWARWPAASMRLAISAMLPGLIVTEAPSGVLIVMSPPAPALAQPPMPMRPIGATSASTAPRTMPATMAQTMTTAV